jgi:hypothetical protein
VVTLTGSAEVPTTKPFNELTGPEKVVVAIYESSHASSALQSACRPPESVCSA